jgi:hypothetical protein
MGHLSLASCLLAPMACLSLLGTFTNHDRITKRLQDKRDRLLWYPEIPSPELIFDGIMPFTEKTTPKVPITTTFFGENDGRYITQMSAIGAAIFDWCHIIRLHFEFIDDSIERCLGDVDYGKKVTGMFYQGTGWGVSSFSLSLWMWVWY